MRFTDVIAASLVAPLVAAHGGIEGAPKIFGMPKQLRASNPFAGHQARHAAPQLVARQGGNAEGRCGTQGGNAKCAEGYCCSPEGYCGNTQAHCQAPDCQFNFGSGCDANKTPAGATTRNDPRPQLGSIPYGGAGIYVCNNPGTVAITYDDGPYIYTAGVLDKFKAAGGHATFFITGNNIGKGAIDENWSGIIKRMYEEGHQVASHTWSHQDLSKITEEQVYDQMVKNEMALRNILGKYPTYMRPPYSSCEATCQSVLKKLGYVVTYFDLDTDDYNHLTTDGIQVAKDNFKNGIDTRNQDPYDGDRLSIAHDIHQLSAETLTEYMLAYLKEQGLRAVTMGECLKDPKENWYRDSTPAPPSTSSTRSSSAPAATPTGPTSTDGNCGSTTTGKGQSCVGWVGLDGLKAECCSQYGYCGNTADHCQTGCQAGFGKCGAQPSQSPVVSKASSATGPIPTPTGPTSTDGNCGSSTEGKGQSCVGWVGIDGLKAECCSQYGYCGNTVDHCQTGCQAGFGKCGTQIVSASSSAPMSSKAASSSAPASSKAASSALASSKAVSSSIHVASSSVQVSATASHVSSAASATPTTSGEMSRDGSCGGSKGYTCVGFKTLDGVLSECCSAWGYCGSSADHCNAECNPIYGKCPGVSSSAAVSSKHDATSSATPASSSAVHSSASVSQEFEKHESSSAVVSHASSAVVSHASSAVVSHASSTGVYPASTPASVSKDNVYSTGSASDVYPASTPVHSSGSSAVYPSGSSAVYPSGSSAVYPSGSSVEHPHVSSTQVYPDVSSTQAHPASSTPCETSTPVHEASSTSVYAASSAPVYQVSSAPIYKVSSFSTAIVKPSSTPCTTSAATATPTPKVSKDGKCGSENGGQTCAGYKSPWGIQMGCCCKQSGRCSIDPWACGVGCNKGYGKCWF